MIKKGKEKLISEEVSRGSGAYLSFRAKIPFRLGFLHLWRQERADPASISLRKCPASQAEGISDSSRVPLVFFVLDIRFCKKK